MSLLDVIEAKDVVLAKVIRFYFFIVLPIVGFALFLTALQEPITSRDVLLLIGILLLAACANYTVDRLQVIKKLKTAVVL